MFRFDVKNVSVNAKISRTKCIIILFGLDQTNQENQTRIVKTINNLFQLLYTDTVAKENWMKWNEKKIELLFFL